jgi:hypothetical protein
MDNHYLILSNRKRLVVIEKEGNVTIATVGIDGDIEYYLCRIDSNGVLVYTNSGDAVYNLTEGLKS